MGYCPRLYKVLVMASLCACLSGGFVAFAGNGILLPSHVGLKAALESASALGVNNEGIFTPARIWAAIVERSGRVKEVTKTTGSDPWPGSRQIAMQRHIKDIRLFLIFSLSACIIS